MEGSQTYERRNVASRSGRRLRCVQGFTAAATDFIDTSSLTLFIASSAEFTRQGNKNKLTEANQRKILDAFIARKDSDHFARLVENAEIAANGYNIAVSSYVEQEDTREAVDITALNAEIARIVARQAELRAFIDAIVADLEGDEA